MITTEPLNIGQVLTAQARLQPNRTGARDLTRQMSFRQWNRRACQLANALTGLGLARVTGLPSWPTTASSGRRSSWRRPRRASLPYRSISV
jgi:acyl-CoA synthetase (AMP-forming)/AMP-acid ligase II